MATSTIVLIVVVAVVAVLLIAGLAWLARSERNRHRRAEAGTIRVAAKTETLRVGQQEAQADGTAAQARIAKSESEDWAAQVSGLQQQAAAQRAEAAIGREELVEAAIAREELSVQWDRADELDPASPTPDTPKSADHSQPQHH